MPHSSLVLTLALASIVGTCGGTGGAITDGGDNDALAGDATTDAPSDVVADVPAADGPTPTSFEGSHAFPEIVVPSGGELLNLCQSWTLDNDTELWVNSVTMDAGPGWHHSNWVFVGENAYAGPDGTWNCSDRSFSEAVAGALGGVFFAQSTQATHEVQQFPAGTAYRIPRRAKIIGSVHLINASRSELRSGLRFQVSTLPESDVRLRLRPLAIDNSGIRIPPRGRAAITTNCDLATGYRNATGHGLDFSVYYVLPHYHTMGRGMRLTAVGGPRDGQTVYETSVLVGDPLGGMLTTPFDLTGVTNLRMTCTYQNPTDNTVRWGLHATDEMCTMLMYTSAETTFGGTANSIAESTTGADGVVTHESPCDMRTIRSP